MKRILNRLLKRKDNPPTEPTPKVAEKNISPAPEPAPESTSVQTEFDFDFESAWLGEAKASFENVEELKCRVASDGAVRCHC